MRLFSRPTPATGSEMRLVAGLGNPGSEYDGTPHNIGYAVADELARRSGVSFRRGPKPKMESVRIPSSGAVLLKPTAYMNLSGEPVKAAMKWFNVPAANLFVICDDVNLPLGRMRLRRGGGPGGQKGLLSICEQLGTEEFARLRIGVGGGEPGADVGAYVLAKLRGERKDEAERMIRSASDAVECWMRDGLEAAMNQYNQSSQE